MEREEVDYEHIRFDERIDFRCSKETKQKIMWIFNVYGHAYDNESHVIRAAVNFLYKHLKEEQKDGDIKRRT